MSWTSPKEDVLCLCVAAAASCVALRVACAALLLADVTIAVSRRSVVQDTPQGKHFRSAMEHWQPVPLDSVSWEWRSKELKQASEALQGRRALTLKVLRRCLSNLLAEGVGLCGFVERVGRFFQSNLS